MVGCTPGGTLCCDLGFLTYTMRNELRELMGDLEREHAEVVQSLKPENQPTMYDLEQVPTCKRS